MKQKKKTETTKDKKLTLKLGARWKYGVITPFFPYNIPVSFTCGFEEFKQIPIRCTP